MRSAPASLTATIATALTDGSIKTGASGEILLPNAHVLCFSPRAPRGEIFFARIQLSKGPIVRSHRLVLAQIVQVVEAAGLKTGV
jgi:hypothetical protein